VIGGRPGRFSGGFDLSIMTSGADAVVALVQSGFELAERILGFPRPVVIACTGHAVAMGAILLCSADHRVGAAGEFKIVANEVAIGMTLPYSALALMRYRLTPPAFDRAVGLATPFTPESAVTAGWLDEIVAPDAVVATAQAAAASFTALDANAHAASKRRARAVALQGVRRGIDSGDRE
jgi:enoyl-CoA hydratase